MYLISLSPWASPSRKDMTSSQSLLSTSCMLNKHLFFFLPQCWDLRKCPYRATSACFIESSDENSIQPIWVLWDQPTLASLAKGPWPRADCRPPLSWEQVPPSQCDRPTKAQRHLLFIGLQLDCEIPLVVLLLASRLSTRAGRLPFHPTALQLLSDNSPQRDGHCMTWGLL